MQVNPKYGTIFSPAANAHYRGDYRESEKPSKAFDRFMHNKDETWSPEPTKNEKL